jgi:hypothetical protein
VFIALNGKGVSTALATIAIILVLVMSLTWMAYTVVLNARQQAQAAERAESIALKAKELIRVYVWLDPAQQTNGQYLNLTRISFVGSWSGETTINGLLVVYRDGGSRMLGLNIRLGAGEEKTYLPSELGIMGLDSYDAFRRAVKYIQAHTSLGNDFVNLWGRPDKPAIYIVTTTNTTTTTTTSTTTPPTTTTTTTTTPPTTTTTTGPTTSTVTSTDHPDGYIHPNLHIDSLLLNQMHGHYMGRRIIDGNDDGYINSNVLGDLHIDDHPYNNSYLYFHIDHMGYVNRNQHSHIRLHGVDHHHEHLLGDNYENIDIHLHDNDYHRGYCDLR